MLNQPNSSICKTKAFLYILVLSMLLRLFWLLFIPINPVSDSIMYDVFAQSISQGNGYAYPDGSLTAYWPVGTSAIYATLYYVFGHTFTVISMFNLFIGVISTALVMLLAERWIDRKSAIFAGLIYALWPSQIQFTSVLASELIFNCFVLAGLFLWPRPTNLKLFPLVLATSFFVLACYVRPIALLIPFILITLQFLNQHTFKSTLKTTICVAITMTILIAPWSLRNHHIFNDFVLISTNGAPVLWMGNNPDSDGGYMPLPELEFASEVERSNYFKQQAFEHIRAEPTLFLKRCFVRLVDYYKSETIGVHWNKTSIEQSLGGNWLLPLKIHSTVYWSLILLLAIAGGYHLHKQTNKKKLYFENPMFSLIAYFTFIHMIIASGDRYHFPIIPFMAVLSGYYISLFQLKLLTLFPHK